MSGKSTTTRNDRRAKSRRLNLAKKIGNQDNHVKKSVSNKRAFRCNARRAKLHNPRADPPVGPSLKFSSFNINGLDTKAGHVIEELLEDRGFDVRFI